MARILIDTELKKALEASPPRILTGVDQANVMRQVAGCAIQLHIGGIFRPGTDPAKPGSSGAPRQRCSLLEGETAVIQTAESFTLDESHTAIVLPVSSVSIQGLLMTNPGHVDPGYTGPVHVTVINMGSQPFELRAGDRILRALIIGLDERVEKPYVAPPKPTVTEELLGRLSPDFLSVNARGVAAAKKEIDSAIRANAFLQYVVPALVGVLSAAVVGWYSNYSVSKDFERRIKTIESADHDINADGRLRTLESDFALEGRLSAIDGRLQRIEARDHRQNEK